MASYLIGDVQGCDEPLGRLLQAIDFSPSRDTVYVLGDLVNRGPASAEVLRRLMALEGSARCLLGNHDMHLLACAWGVRRPHKRDTLDALLAAPDRAALLDWLRCQPLAIHETVGGREMLLVHAGVLPQWTAQQTAALAAELQDVLRGPHIGDFLHGMYGNQPDRWDDALSGNDRLRVVINALTRLRFCSADGQMEFETKEGAGAAPAGFMPWFEVPGRRTAGVAVAFGHWSTLGWLDRDDLYCLDTGCVWGGPLSALRVGTSAAQQALVQVDCPQAQKPG
ncbi:bis(5'-nucleosyl)-tetraphosphatase, symmetrical [Pseudorhodoferax aquiterrae]|uniref:Bis(5'-nucleosyl)-tetraphosphatase, symmetrical n=1 Tax=Pseudorhodoferax aquiterrae TaxID=747304 RepID=A0ABQ3GCH1_9BURK|nr:symmetrical bis(5'-nucleosyl)-tetraphosphatase [Pseudorhodoferax aquiterrae]GHD01666.1 bis(5'-nucleosyl)-tetraphosphatase, symmetrical [Pseudorhodoferax aquiterrae]